MIWEMEKSYFGQSAIPLVVSPRLHMRIVRGNRNIQRSKKKCTKETLTWTTGNLSHLCSPYLSVLPTHVCFE